MVAAAANAAAQHHSLLGKGTSPKLIRSRRSSNSRGSVSTSRIPYKPGRPISLSHEQPDCAALCDARDSNANSADVRQYPSPSPWGGWERELRVSSPSGVERLRAGPQAGDANWRRRQLLSASAAAATAVAFLAAPLPLPARAAEEAVEVPAPSFALREYVGDGFALLVPASWEEKSKSGATALFEDPANRKCSVGVVVNPVRIASLSQFGSIDFVADKLIEAEKRKESTKEATILRLKESQVELEPNGGASANPLVVPVYKLEYDLKSTRGDKRIFTTVVIAQNRLNILNIAVPLAALPVASVEGEMLEDVLRRIQDSFRLVL